MSVRRGYVVLFLVFLTLGIYYPAIFSGANSIDDPQIITAYLNVEHLDLKALFLPGGSGYYYRPLLGLTLYFDSVAWGMRESFMHLENIVFHAVNVILVYFITVKLANKYSIENKILPLIAALTFSIHPINTESVNWISGRTDLLACLFILLTIVLLLNSFQFESKIAGLAASLMFLLGCFSKEVAVCALPGLLFLSLFYDYHESAMQSLKKRWLSFVLLIASASIYFMFRYFAFSHGDSGMKLATDTVKLPASNLFDSIRIILKALGFYTKKLFVPWPLNFAIVTISDYYVIIGVLLIIGLVLILYYKSAISAFFLTSICLVMPALLPAFGRMTWTPLAERYLYIAAATFCIAISFLVSMFLRKSNSFSRTFILACIAVIFAISTHTTVNRNITWQSNVTLFQDALRKSPNFFLVQNALAQALEQDGRRGEAKPLILSMVAPESNIRGQKLVDSNRAKMMVADGDLRGARKLLIRNLDDSGVLYTNLVEQIISIDINLLNVETDKRNLAELRSEIEMYLLKLQERNGDPLYFYRIGQFYLTFKDTKKARHFFSKAYQHSPEGSHYKEAARKLSEKLR